MPGRVVLKGTDGRGRLANLGFIWTVFPFLGLEVGLGLPLLLPDTAA